MKKHWTTISVKDFAFAISMDFVGDLELEMDKKGISQKELASRLGISEGRVSQIVNNPGNLTLKSAVEWANALGNKVALIAYVDNDQSNSGPLVPEIFRSCWQALGKPMDGEALAQAISTVVRLGPAANDNTTGWKDVKGGFKIWSQTKEKQDWKGPCKTVDCSMSSDDQNVSDCQCMAGG